jgi:uncharacterized protein
MLRRHLLLTTPALAGVAPALAQAAPLPFYTAGPGSAFLPYGEALARFTATQGLPLDVRHSAGSFENLRRVEEEPGAIATAFLGSVVDALAGSPAVQGRRHRNIRALFPMYETGFMAVALRSRGLTQFADLAGRKVGCGPARGPAESFFRAAAEVAGISAEIVSGGSAELAEATLRGEIDALWQGAILPIPALVQVANAAPSVIIGPGEATARGVVARLPHLAPLRVAAGTYRGQEAEVHSFAGWNFVVAHAELPEATAHALTRAVLMVDDPAARIGAMAAGTRAANAGTNRVLAFHPGAVRALREAGVTPPDNPLPG